MNALPQDLHYSAEHEWVAFDEASKTATIGVTDFAVRQLGDIVLVDLPEVGATVESGETMGEVESTKSVSDLYSPVTGEVVEINQELVDAPEKLNEDAWAHWMIKVSCQELPGDLLDAAAYGELIGE